MKGTISLILGLFTMGSITVYGQDMEGNPPEDIVKYYFVELITNPERPEMPQAIVDSLQQAHMINLATMFKDKQLILAGPFEGGGGILVLDVPTLEDAQQLVARDPHVKAGRLLIKIRAWYTAKGALAYANHN